MGTKFSGSNAAPEKSSPEKSSPEKSSRFLSRKSVLRPALGPKVNPPVTLKPKLESLQILSSVEHVVTSHGKGW